MQKAVLRSRLRLPVIMPYRFVRYLYTKRLLYRKNTDITPETNKSFDLFCNYWYNNVGNTGKNENTVNYIKIPIVR